MDVVQAAEQEFDYFSLILPLPYRVALAIVFGVWAWGTNLHYLFLSKIDVPLLIHHPPRISPRNDPPHYLSTYRIALLLTAPLVLSLVLFWAISHQNPVLVAYYNFLPITYLCLVAGIFIFPLRRFSRSGRSRFVTTLRRITFGGLAQSKDVKLGDILLADVLTSYAKTLADLFISLCMLFNKPRGSVMGKPDRTCGGLYSVPIIVAIPSLIRLCQCLTEYYRVCSAHGRGYGNQHLANALKYASAFPVIIFSTLQRHPISKYENAFFTEKDLYNCWLLAIFINSMYSFYWDVTKDWDLTFFSTVAQLLHSLFCRATSSAHTKLLHSSTKGSFGLRSQLCLPSPTLYYLAIIIDFFLRCVWVLQLFPHLDHSLKSELGITFLGFTEIIRRWIWIFLRLEAEWVRTSVDNQSSEPRVIDYLVKDYDEDSD